MHKTTFATEWGKFRYRRAPQGFLSSGMAGTRTPSQGTAQWLSLLAVVDGQCPSTTANRDFEKILEDVNTWSDLWRGLSTGSAACCPTAMAWCSPGTSSSSQGGRSCSRGSSSLRKGSSQLPSTRLPSETSPQPAERNYSPIEGEATAIFKGRKSINK